MPVCVNMEQCLTNGANKQRLIFMFICALHCAGYEQFGKASDDADVLLVQTSLQIADTYATVMIAEYTSCPSVIKHTPTKLPWCLYRTWTNQRQQYSDMPRRHRSVFVPQHCFLTCLWSYGAVWHHCTYVWHQQECTPEENISADDTFMQNARNFWGMTVETTTTAGGQ